jgi:hypothetical protein
MQSTAQIDPTSEVREMAGVTLKEAAEVAGVAVSTMWAAERKREKLSEEQWKALLDFYQKRLEERSKRVIESLGAATA